MPKYLSISIRINSTLKKLGNAATLLLLVAFLFPCQVTAQKPIVSKAAGYALSSPVRDFGIAKPEPGKTTSRRFVGEDESINKNNEKLVKKIIPGLPDKISSRIQSTAVINITNLVSAPITSFDGNSNADNAAAYGGMVYPPDVNGDVGPNHYVQTTNLLVGIFDKITGALVVPKFKMSTLFASLGPPFSTTDNGDPIVLYDQLADRWLISQFLFTSVSGGVYYQMIAISQTGDPTGAYYVYAFLMPNNKLNDYPHFGVWPDGYYMADNQFTNGASFSGAGAFAFDRVKMLVGDPTASYIYFDQAGSCPSCGGQLPTDLDGFATPPVGSPNLFMEYRATEYGDPADGLRIFAFHADFTTPANSTFTQVGGTDLPLAAFDARNPNGRGDIEQPAPSTITTYLDGLSDRLMHRLAYRILPGGAQSFVGNFTVNVSGLNPISAATYQAGIKWFELRRSAGGVMSVNDEGIYAPGAGNGATGRNIWMAGIAQDGEGNLGLGYSASSTTLHPSILYTGRLTSDPPGTMAQGENTLVAGSGVQLGTANRWGDYSSMSVDPVDECTFWYTQEYYTAASQASSTVGWLTRIGSFKVNPTCVVSNRGNISGTVTNCETGLPIANAVVTTPDGFFTKTNAAGQFSILAASGTYTVVITASGGYNTCTTNNVVVTNGGNTVVNCCLTPVSIMVSAGAILTAENCNPPNAAIDPNETVTVNFSLSNTDGLNTTNLVATLQASGGVTAPSSAQNYGVVVTGGASVSRPFTFTAANLFCGDLVTATLQLQDGAKNLGTVTYTFITGAASTAVGTFSYTGPPVPIPDNNSTGINIPITVSGAGTKVTDLNFRFDPLAGCNATTGNTNAAVDHSYLSDLIFKLKSPGGRTVIFMLARGGGGKNICNLFLDDDGAFPAISTLPNTGGVSGNYAPENPFSAFDGQTANGTWILNVSDNAGIDVGSVRGFSLVLTSSTPVCCISCTPPTATATPASQAICSGSSITTIALSGTGSGTVYNWVRDNPAVTGIAASGSGDISGSLTNTTNAPITITFTITPTANNCVGAAITATVTVNPIANAVATPSSQTICTGNVITAIALSGNVAGTVYNWTRDNLTVTGIAASGSGNISGSLTNATAAPVTVTFTITPSYTNDGVTCTGTPVTATVIVNPLPTITCPGNQSTNNAPGLCSAVVNYSSSSTGVPAPTITYAFTGATTGSGSGNGSGSTFNVGVTNVTLTATNACGTPTCSFTVTVQDNTLPVISGCPGNQTVTVSSSGCTATATWTQPTATDNCTAPLTYYFRSHAPGSSFPGGITTVTYKFKDATGNESVCSFNITVNSTLAASISDKYAYSPGTAVNTIYLGWTPASKITYTASVSGGQSVYTYKWTTTAGLNIIGSSTQSSVQVTSTTVGTYTLTLKVTDAYGCQKTTTKTVTVVDVRCGNKMDKVQVCKTQPVGNICIEPGSVANQLANGASLGACPSSSLLTKSNVAVKEELVVPSLTVKALPNPSSYHFNLVVHSTNKNDRVSLRVTNILGQVVEVRNTVPLEQVIRMGNTFKSGTYVVEVVQGEMRQQIKLVKL